MGLGERLTSLGERHNVIYGKEQHVKVENVVIIKGDGKNRALSKIWTVAVEKLIRDKDGVISVVLLRAEPITINVDQLYIYIYIYIYSKKQIYIQLQNLLIANSSQLD